ncbi:MAG: PASTA domain-containing protein [Acidobacteria bacterium]|nr:PASTA domain-containing protein [Acidobacteriota bacterium]
MNERTGVLALGKLLLLLVILLASGTLSALTAMRYALRGGVVVAPKVVGLPVTRAEQRLRETGLGLVVEGVRSHDSVPKDSVLVQDPSPGTKMKVHSRVRCILSAGRRTLQVPDLGGKSLRAAEIVLQGTGLSIGTVTQLSLAGRPPQTVLLQDPPVNAAVSAGQNVDLLVNTEPRKQEYVMPDLVGREVNDVIALFEKKSFTIEKIAYNFYADTEKGLVVGQLPPRGAKLVEGDRVSLEVSQ